MSVSLFRTDQSQTFKAELLVTAFFHVTNSQKQQSACQFCSAGQVALLSHSWVTSSTSSKCSVSLVNTLCLQTGVPLWWRRWTRRRGRRRSPPRCCWEACTAGLQLPWCRSPLGRWGQPCRRGPLRGTERRRKVNVISSHKRIFQRKLQLAEIKLSYKH